MQLVELESELSAEQRRSRQFQADCRKLQRVVIELKTQSEEDRRQVAERNEVNNSLQVKIKTLKRQLAEAVSIISLAIPVLYSNVIFITIKNEIITETKKCSF